MNPHVHAAQQDVTGAGADQRTGEAKLSPPSRRRRHAGHAAAWLKPRLAGACGEAGSLLRLSCVGTARSRPRQRGSAGRLEPHPSKRYGRRLQPAGCAPTVGQQAADQTQRQAPESPPRPAGGCDRRSRHRRRSGRHRRCLARRARAAAAAWPPPVARLSTH